MTDAIKAALLLGTLALATLGGGIYGAHQSAAKAAAIAQAHIQEGRALAAEDRETSLKAAKAAADQRADQALAEVAHLKAQAAHHPTPAPAQPVPPDASVGLVLAGLHDLGLKPGQLDLPDLALGLTLPDARTTLQWGREAQRVPPLAARLGALEALAQAQEGAASALLQRASAADQALAAADTRADAQAHRAESLQRALDLTPRDRPWSAGLLVGLDTTGTRRAGAYLTRSWGPVQAQVVVLGNTAAIGGGIRF